MKRQRVGLKIVVGWMRDIKKASVGEPYRGFLTCRKRLLNIWMMFPISSIVAACNGVFL